LKSTGTTPVVRPLKSLFQKTMKIGVIKIYPVRVPHRLRYPARINSPVTATNIIIEISDAKNRFRGFGEGCLPPQKQVFLEDWIKAAAAFLSVNSFPWNLSSIYEIRAYIESLPTLGSLNPVVCAIETALLDILGRKQDRPLLAYFPSHHAAGFIRYGASIPVWFSKRQTVMVCRAAHRLGIRHIRVGVGNTPLSTLNRLQTITGIVGRDCFLRLNPDFSWDPVTTDAHMPLLQRFPVSALEDPLPEQTEALAEFAPLFRSMGIKLVAGRSATTVETAAAAIDSGLYDAVSIQLSRSGGFHRSLQLIDYLRQAEFDFQIGCHPAEACILSAAGHALNLLCRDAVNREAASCHFMADPEVPCGLPVLSEGGGAVAVMGTGLGKHINRDTVANLEKNRFDGRRTTLTITSSGSAV
jgi:L-alanine-DL-glutamate epimerase-like enolase superfamily enzyme